MAHFPVQETGKSTVHNLNTRIFGPKPLYIRHKPTFDSQFDPKMAQFWPNFGPILTQISTKTNIKPGSIALRDKYHQTKYQLSAMQLLVPLLMTSSRKMAKMPFFREKT